MATTDLGEFDLGESIQFDAVVTNQSGTKVNTTSMVIRIDAPDGTTLQADTAMTNDATGEYSYWYTISAETTGQLGEYSARAKSTDASSHVSIQRFKFTAVKSI